MFKFIIRPIIASFVLFVLYSLLYLIAGLKWDPRLLSTSLTFGFIISYYGLSGIMYVIRKKHPDVEELITYEQKLTIELEGQPVSLFDVLKDRMVTKHWELMEADKKSLYLQFRVGPYFEVFKNNVHVSITTISDNHFKVQINSQPSLHILEYVLFDSTKNRKNIKKVKSFIKDWKEEQIS